MTPDTQVAALLIGAALITLGGGIIAVCRSAWAERRTVRHEAEATATAEHVAELAAMRGLPEPEWATPFDERARLRSVPVTGAHLSVVPPPADDSWLEDLITSRPNPFTIPSQRDGSAS